MSETVSSGSKIDIAHVTRAALAATSRAVSQTRNLGFLEPLNIWAQGTLFHTNAFSKVLAGGAITKSNIKYVSAAKGGQLAETRDAYDIQFRIDGQERKHVDEDVGSTVYRTTGGETAYTFSKRISAVRQSSENAGDPAYVAFSKENLRDSNLVDATSFITDTLNTSQRQIGQGLDVAYYALWDDEHDVIGFDGTGNTKTTKTGVQDGVKQYTSTLDFNDTTEEGANKNASKLYNEVIDPLLQEGTGAGMKNYYFIVPRYVVSYFKHFYHNSKKQYPTVGDYANTPGTHQDIVSDMVEMSGYTLLADEDYKLGSYDDDPGTGLFGYALHREAVGVKFYEARNSNYIFDVNPNTSGVFANLSQAMFAQLQETNLYVDQHSRELLNMFNNYSINWLPESSMIDRRVLHTEYFSLTPSNIRHDAMTNELEVTFLRKRPGGMTKSKFPDSLAPTAIAEANIARRKARSQRNLSGAPTTASVDGILSKVKRGENANSIAR